MMNLDLIKKIDEWRWSIPCLPHEKRAPVILYGNELLLQSMDAKVLEQILNIAHLPGLIGPAMTMPDAHSGYGFPIGGIAAFDADLGGVISAGGVGFDISCGIRTLRTDLALEDISPVLPQLAEALFKAIPAGLGKGGTLWFSLGELDRMMENGAIGAVQQGWGNESDLAFIEEQGRMAGAHPENVSDTAKKRQQEEMGTLGSGNHYLEVQMVERIEDQASANSFGLSPKQIVISIHCGSRSLGHQVGTDYLSLFWKESPRFGLVLPDKELACAPIRSELGQKYIGAMRAGINIALANRQILTHLVRTVFERFFPKARITTLYDVSHNTCKEETHLVAGKKRTLWVHRKGATRAFGPGHPSLPKPYQKTGQPVFIGGSMGTGSWILAGIAESEERSFSSASHGSGRAMSRHEALKQWNGRDLVKGLGAQGIIIRSHSMRRVAEEAPGAYKNIDVVSQATEQAGLARRVAFLRPKICIKG